MTLDQRVRGALISGIGISRIGRKTGLEALELTAESSLAAMADAGLTPADVDGIATIGDTPLAVAAETLGISPTWTGGSLGYYGLLTPVVDACAAVARGRRATSWCTAP